MEVGFRMFPANWIVTNYLKLLQNTSSAPIITWFFNSLFVSTTHALLVKRWSSRWLRSATQGSISKGGMLYSMAYLPSRCSLQL